RTPLSPPHIYSYTHRAALSHTPLDTHTHTHTHRHMHTHTHINDRGEPSAFSLIGILYTKNPIRPHSHYHGVSHTIGLHKLWSGVAFCARIFLWAVQRVTSRLLYWLLHGFTFKLLTAKGCWHTNKTL